MHIVDGWLVEANEHNLMGNSWPRNGIPPTHLVIHGTAGGSDGGSVAAYMGSVGVSTHFVISVDGTPWQCVSADAAAWANAPLKSPTLNFAQADLNPNLWTISIEFCKPDTTNQINITDAQKQSGFALIAAICDNYNIPKRRGDGARGIIGHCDINSVDRAHCPGTFPWDDLWHYLETGATQTVLTIDQASNYFTETTKDTRWHCKQTNQDIAFGILMYYRTCSGVGLNGLSLFGLPVSIEMGIPGVPGATYQIFERAVLCYDPSHKVDSVPGITGPCYPGHLDKYLPLQSSSGGFDKAAAISTLQTAQAATGAISSAIQTILNELKVS